MRAIPHRIRAGEQTTVHQPEGIDPPLSVVAPVIHDLSNRAREDDRAKGKRDTMPREIGRILGVVELDIHDPRYGNPV